MQIEDFLIVDMLGFSGGVTQGSSSSESQLFHRLANIIDDNDEDLSGSSKVGQMPRICISRAICRPDHMKKFNV